MDGSARAALAVDAGLGAGEQPLDLAELGVGLLQLGGPAGEHVEAVVVADRHLVGQPAEVPGELGHALGELALAGAQLWRASRSRVTVREAISSFRSVRRLWR